MTTTIKSSELTNFILIQIRSGSATPGTEIRPADNGTVKVETPNK